MHGSITTAQRVLLFTISRFGIMALLIASLPLTLFANDAYSEGSALNEEVIELYRNKNYSQAEPLAKKALERAEKSLGPVHPLVAICLNNLAAVYKAQGKYVAAEPLYRRALAIRESTYGAEHPFVATSLDNLALLYKAEGKFAEAEQLYRRSLAIEERAYGTSHPIVVQSMDNLASFYREAGMNKAAEEMEKRESSIRAGKL